MGEISSCRPNPLRWDSVTGRTLRNMLRHRDLNVACAKPVAASFRSVSSPPLSARGSCGSTPAPAPRNRAAWQHGRTPTRRHLPPARFSFKLSGLAPTRGRTSSRAMNPIDKPRPRRAASRSATGPRAPWPPVSSVHQPPRTNSPRPVFPPSPSIVPARPPAPHGSAAIGAPPRPAPASRAKAPARTTIAGHVLRPRTARRNPRSAPHLSSEPPHFPPPASVSIRSSSPPPPAAGAPPPAPAASLIRRPAPRRPHLRPPFSRSGRRPRPRISTPADSIVMAEDHRQGEPWPVSISMTALLKCENAVQ